MGDCQLLVQPALVPKAHSMQIWLQTIAILRGFQYLGKIVKGQQIQERSQKFISGPIQAPTDEEIGK